MTVTEQIRHVLHRCPDVDWSMREIRRAVALEYGTANPAAIADTMHRMWVQGELGRDEGGQSNRYFVVEGWEPKRKPAMERMEVA